jgi:hypothetical protein
VWVIDAEGIRRLPDRCPSAAGPTDGEAATSASINAAPSELCDPPWFVDVMGIQRVRQQCLAADVEPPALASSVLSPSAPAPSEGLDAGSDCDPMYWVDVRGIQRLRVECL